MIVSLHLDAAQTLEALRAQTRCACALSAIAATDAAAAAKVQTLKALRAQTQLRVELSPNGAGDMPPERAWAVPGAPGWLGSVARENMVPPPLSVDEVSRAWEAFGHVRLLVRKQSVLVPRIHTAKGGSVQERRRDGPHFSVPKRVWVGQPIRGGVEDLAAPQPPRWLIGGFGASFQEADAQYLPAPLGVLAKVYKVGKKAASVDSGLGNKLDRGAFLILCRKLRAQFGLPAHAR
ncbi:hypothetical protein T492DRAFT_1140270 [Pavlovales sp. CCMP2436]|nr:hypothetical protein T492DRAFT_1140270 [Pavlovales sp. CCMP2436]